MIDYGAPPTVDEIEITLFGPGFGEAIAIHLGDGVWILVDSCIEPDSSRPATEAYLDRFGIVPEQVRTIIASHWHDDHVRGIAKLAEKYQYADFVISSVFNTKEASAFLAAYSGASSLGLSRGAKELFEVVCARGTVFPAQHRSNVLEISVNAKPITVTALSPTPGAFARSVAHLAQFLPCKGQPINHAPELRENYEAVALHIDLGDDAVLLGADLEDHHHLGWSAVVADKWSGARRPATAYKVAHHGSHTGHCPQVWATLLRPNPIACLTPWTLGGRRLPSETDKALIRENTQHAYISSGASRRPEMDSRVLKRLGDICNKIARVDAGFGAVRLRRQFSAKTWSVEMFGAAQPL